MTGSVAIRVAFNSSIIWVQPFTSLTVVGVATVTV